MIDPIELQEEIDCWEPTAEDGAEVIHTIDSINGVVHRVVKCDGLYFLYRYFTTQVSGMTTVVCSVDLNGVEADEVIQYLGELI